MDGLHQQNGLAHLRSIVRLSRYNRHHNSLTQRAIVLVNVRPNIALNPSGLVARTAASMKKESCK